MLLENRNCGCMQNNQQNCECMGNNLENCDCDYTPQGINAAFGYNTANMMQDDGCNCQMTPEQCCDERSISKSIWTFKHLLSM